MQTGTEGYIQPRVTFTLNTERNCAVVDLTPNMELQLCCDPAVVEVVYNPALTVGDFFVDNEGNCWQAQAKTGAPTTSSRTVTTSYASCEACIAANECPANLIVQSCCEAGPETFTGSLPGIVVGDTFVDTYGFCWTAIAETPAPTTGTVYVDTNLGNVECSTCVTSNPCPVRIELIPCCDRQISAWSMITTDALLGYTTTDGEVIVDTFGVCYTVIKPALAGGGVTVPFISYSATYGVGDNCGTCTTAHTCPPTLYYEVINCCTGDTETVIFDVIISPDTVLLFSLDTSPNVAQCWKVVSYSNTGTATITLGQFFGAYKSCRDCIRDFKDGCPTYYEVADCCGVAANEVMLLPFVSTNIYYMGQTYSDTNGNCWYIVGETTGPDTVAWDSNRYDSCTDCNDANSNCTMVKISSCCADLVGATSLESLGGGVAVGYNFVDQFGACWEVIGDATGSGLPAAYNFINVASIYSTTGSDCVACVQDHACPTNVYYTLQNCCTGETKVAYYGFGYLAAGLSYQLITSLDGNNEWDCWKVISWSTTGTATITINTIGPSYDTCIQCVGIANQCHDYYIAKSCCSLPDAVVYLPSYIHDSGFAFSDSSNKCWTTLAPTVGPATITWSGSDYGDCTSCIADGNPC